MFQIKLPQSTELQIVVYCWQHGQRGGVFGVGPLIVNTRNVLLFYYETKPPSGKNLIYAKTGLERRSTEGPATMGVGNVHSTKRRIPANAKQ